MFIFTNKICNIALLYNPTQKIKINIYGNKLPYACIRFDLIIIPYIYNIHSRFRQFSNQYSQTSFRYYITLHSSPSYEFK